MGSNMSQFLTRECASIATSVAVVAIGYTCSHDMNEESMVTTLVNVGHVGALSMWFGIQTWVSFIAGLTKRKILPRPWFGKVQEMLFQKYFLGGLMLNSIMLGTYLVNHPINTWEGETLYKGGSIVGALSLVSLSLYFKPSLDAIVVEMNEYEFKNGHSEVVGPIKSETLLKDEKYQSLRTSFLKGHGIAMAINFVIYPITMYHLYSVAKSVKF